MSDKRTGWLADLKVGDKVVLDKLFADDMVGQITNITPTGRMTVTAGDYSYNCDASGRQMGEQGYYRMHMVQLTPERAEKIRRKNLQDALKAAIHYADLTKIPTDELRTLLATFKQYRNKEE